MATTPTAELMEAIEGAKIRADVVLAYREAISLSMDGVVIDWSDVNRAVITKWSKSGLGWIKAKAWARDWA